MNIRKPFLIFVLAMSIPCCAKSSGVTQLPTITVVGVPHLTHRLPAATQQQLALAIDALSDLQPTVVCVESDTGEHILAMTQSPAKFGEVTTRYSLAALRLGIEQQQRSGHSQPEAAARIRDLERSVISESDRVRLLQLQLAALEPWSALLNWSRLSPTARESSIKILGRQAKESLDSLEKSNNEIVSLAIPVAMRGNHNRVCTVDRIGIELDVVPLAPQLGPLLDNDAVKSRLAELNRLEQRAWMPSNRCSLLAALSWYNSKNFENADKDLQWANFTTNETKDIALKRRLALWHARNAAIIAELLRNAAREDGLRVVLIIGASHKPYIDRMLSMLEGLALGKAESVLARKLEGECKAVSEDQIPSSTPSP